MKKNLMNNKKYKLPILIILLLILLISIFLFFNFKKEITGLVGYTPRFPVASVNPELIEVSRVITNVGSADYLLSSGNYLDKCDHIYNINLKIDVNESLKIKISTITDHVPEEWEILTNSKNYVAVSKNKDSISFIFLDIIGNPIKDSVVSYEVCKKNNNNNFRGYWEAYLDNGNFYKGIIYGEQGDAFFKSRECAPHYGAYCYNNDLYWYDSCGNRQELKKTCSITCIGPKFDIKFFDFSRCSENSGCFDSDGLNESKKGYVIKEYLGNYLKYYDYCLINEKNVLIELTCENGTSIASYEIVECSNKCENGRCI